jgi:hypothetical protein
MSDTNGVRKDFPYRYEVLPIKQLFVDETYQRPLTSFVKRIKEHFDPALVGTLVTSERSKTKFAVVDGQTRMTAMREVGLERAPCLIYTGLTEADEADLFSRLQTERRGMVAANRFRAQVIAKDPFAVALNNIVQEEGFTVGTDTQSNNFCINAIGALETVYRGMKSRRAKFEADEELLRDVLTVLKNAWPKMPEGAKSGALIRGLGYFLLYDEKDQPRGDGGAQVDFERLTRQLSKVQPSQLARNAELLREGRGMSGNSPKYMAEAIHAQYRKRS